MATTPKSTPASTGLWSCVPAREGLLVARSDIREGAFFLPETGIADTPLNQPPLSLLLDDKELSELRSTLPDAPVVASCYGPPEPEQEKLSNQDFALSAVITDPSQSEWHFAAVADGVSTRTFWPERAARLACLAAYKVTRAFITNGEVENQEALGRFRAALCTHLREAFLADREIIAASKLTPCGWDPAIYRDRGKSDEYWYNTTLLIGVLGPAWGFLTWAGDGAIRLVKTEGDSEEERIVLETDERLTIDQFASIGVSPTQFRAARISYPTDNSGAVEVYLSSDGLDRTLQMNDGRWAYRDLNLSSGRAAAKQLMDVWRSDKHERDNFSVAKVYIRVSSVNPKAIPAAKERIVRRRQPVSSSSLPLGPPDNKSNDRVPGGAPPTKDITSRGSKRSEHGWRLVRELCMVLAICFLGYLVLKSRPANENREKRLRHAASAPARVTAPQQQRPQPATASHPKAVPATLNTLPPPANALEPANALRFATYELADPVRRRDIDAKKLNADLADFIDYWAQLIREHRNFRYTVVAYSDRKHPQSGKECRAEASLALQRANFVADQLRSRIGIATLLMQEGRERVCEAPPTVHDIRSLAARRIVLFPAEVSNCACEVALGSTKK
jgi:Protein phosphatase 2C